MTSGNWKIVLGIFIRLRFSVSVTCARVERITQCIDPLPCSLQKRTDILVEPTAFARDIRLTSALRCLYPSSKTHTECYAFDTFFPPTHGKGEVDV